jgi:hypothetical protein
LVACPGRSAFGVKTTFAKLYKKGRMRFGEDRRNSHGED